MVCKLLLDPEVRRPAMRAQFLCWEGERFDALMSEVSAFLTELGPEGVISVNESMCMSADGHRLRLVVVWYWGAPE